MSKKSEFIDYVSSIINVDDMNDEAKAYWDSMINTPEKPKKMFTDNGKLILGYLQTVKEGTSMLSKDIADRIGISSRSVAGAMKKLITDGWVEAMDSEPRTYCVTEAGRNIDIENN